MPYTKGFRYTVIPGSNNQYAVPTKEIQNPNYAATIALLPTQEQTIVVVKQLTGALTMTSDVNTPYAGDTLAVMVQSDGSSRVVTFSTGFTPNGTLTVPSGKEAVAEFIFSDKSQTWLESGRQIQP
jgi:hypothetical protein